ncbi:MAG: cysteine synthase A [Bacteroidales bacterium]|nr:cysteine synthase A [Candidatus Colimorpha onthohippi]
MQTLIQCIGHTPLIEAPTAPGQQARILLKVESFNPGGSSKDRVALAMIEDAEQRGLLQPGSTIIEPTSGNTGIGLAWVGRARGYHVVLTMPETMSIERRQLLQAYGAELVLTPGAEGMSGSIQAAEQLHNNTPGSIILGQFSNPANPAAHYRTTGPELWQQTQGAIDALVAGVGTGGTLCGSARYLLEQNKDIQIIAVEPATSQVLAGKPAAAHGLQGIGANFIPQNYDASLVNDIIPVTDAEAIQAKQKLASDMGLLVGISSGAAYHAALKLSQSGSYQHKTIVAILPDTGERYLSC